MGRLFGKYLFRVLTSVFSACFVVVLSTWRWLFPSSRRISSSHLFLSSFYLFSISWCHLCFALRSCTHVLPLPRADVALDLGFGDAIGGNSLLMCCIGSQCFKVSYISRFKMASLSSVLPFIFYPVYSSLRHRRRLFPFPFHPGYHLFSHYSGVPFCLPLPLSPGKAAPTPALDAAVTAVPPEVTP